MSKGFGVVQRKIIEFLDGDGDGAFRTDELCARIYGWPVQKKHRVAVIRAAKAVVAKRPDLAFFGSSGPDQGLVFYHQGSVMSYARARLKARGYGAERIREGLAEGGFEYRYIQPGGSWWLKVQEWISRNSSSSDKS
jgi:hypothetical protein